MVVFLCYSVLHSAFMGFPKMRMSELFLRSRLGMAAENGRE